MKKAFKIRNKEESILIQQHLYDLGYSWANGEKRRYLYLQELQKDIIYIFLSPQIAFHNSKHKSIKICKHKDFIKSDLDLVDALKYLRKLKLSKINMIKFSLF